MKLAAFYFIVGVAYLAIWAVSPSAAERAFPLVALLLLLPALYAEVERVRRG